MANHQLGLEGTSCTRLCPKLRFAAVVAAAFAIAVVAARRTEYGAAAGEAARERTAVIP